MMMVQLTQLVLAAVLTGVHAQFIDLSNSSNPWSCLAESTGVHVPGTVPCNPYEPLQQHLAFAGPTGMMVSWSTHAQLESPKVWYGESPTALINSCNRELHHLSFFSCIQQSRQNHGTQTEY
ncbi:hypothetical protein JVU11DRAFT_9650 [Chiua virens]|nr:hypothetical protein JVU11DRAFT_9650 [Chiua virens]